jgi:cytochrome P450
MRAEVPVRWNPSADGVGFWSLTRAADIREVSQDSVMFSSGRGGIFLRPDALAPLEFARNFPIFKDPPEHDLYRAIVAQAFSPRGMTLLGQEVQQIVTAVLKEVLAEGATGACDAVADIAVPIPVMVIGRMMGAADEDMNALLAWTREIQDGMTYSRDVTPTFRQMAEYFMGLVGKSRIAGVQNLAREIRLAEIDGRKLTDEEIAVYLGMLLYAGNRPTRDAISGGLAALIAHPEQTELLRQRPALLRPLRSGGAPGGLVEILRWTSPVCYFARTATADTTLGGVPIKAGDRVVMWYPAANRDPEIIPDPDTFDITREASSFSHCVFGGGGAHYCPGDFLANKTVHLAISETLQRLGDLRVSGPVTRVTSAFANGLESLPIRFEPASAQQPEPAQPGPAPTPAPEPTPAPVEKQQKPGLMQRLFGKR